jgi:hypothetical protein
LQLCAGACTHRADGKSKPAIRFNGRLVLASVIKARTADGLAADDALIGEEPAKLLLTRESMRPD